MMKKLVGGGGTKVPLYYKSLRRDATDVVFHTKGGVNI